MKFLKYCFFIIWFNTCGQSLSTGIFLAKSSANPFGTEYQAIISQATALGYTLPSYSTQVLQNAMVVSLKASGVWAKTDILYVFLTGETTLTDFATLNWKSPTTFQITRMNSPTFGIYGFKGNGTTSYLKTGWIPNTNGVNFTLNDASLFAQRAESIVSAGILAGTQVSANTKRTTIEPRFTGSLAVYEVNAALNDSGPNTDGSGFYRSKRTASNNTELFKNGVSIDSYAQVSTAMSTFELYGLCENVSGTATFFEANTISILGAGASMSSQESTDFFAAWNTYLGGVADKVTFPDWVSSSSLANYSTSHNNIYGNVLQIETVTSIGSSVGSLQYEGACISSVNGCIYGAPHNAPTMIKIDPSTDAVSHFGTFNSGTTGSNTLQYIGGVEAPNNKKLYFCPYNATKILVVDPGSADAVSYLSGTVTGTQKYAGIVLGSNGKIYCIPFNAGNVLEIDPTTDTYTTFGTISGTQQYVSGCAVDGGIVYACPFDATQVLKIDIVGHSVSLVGSTLSGSGKWAGFVYAPNNAMIYGIPYGSTSVLKFNPATDGTSTFASGTLVTFESGHLAANGMIYCVPLGASYILKINPFDDTCSQFGSVSGSLRYDGGVLAKNGSIYCPPLSNSDVLKILTPLNFNLDDNHIYSRYSNKY